MSKRYSFHITTTSEFVAKAINTFIVALEAVGSIGAEAMGEAFTFESDIKTAQEKAARAELKGRAQGARVQYKPVLPTDAVARMAAVRENLSAIGEGKLKGLIYQTIVDLSTAGELVTKARIMEIRKITTASTAEREIGDLCRMKLVTSVPLVIASE